MASKNEDSRCCLGNHQMRGRRLQRKITHPNSPDNESDSRRFVSTLTIQETWWVNCASLLIYINGILQHWNLPSLLTVLVCTFYSWILHAPMCIIIWNKKYFNFLCNYNFLYTFLLAFNPTESRITKQQNKQSFPFHVLCNKNGTLVKYGQLSPTSFFSWSPKSLSLKSYFLDIEIYYCSSLVLFPAATFCPKLYLQLYRLGKWDLFILHSVPQEWNLSECMRLNMDIACFH